MNQLVEEKISSEFTTDEMLEVICPSYQILECDEVTIKARIVEVTPTLAKLLLERNTNNRAITPENLNYLVKEIKNGNWKFGGEPIKIDSNGRLIDGQHRLNACIIADKPLYMLILSGLEPSVFTVLDTGRKRQGGDVLSIHGVENSTSVASTIKLVSQIRKGVYGEKGTSTRVLSNEELIKAYNEEPDISASVNNGKRLYNHCNKIISPSIISAFYHILTDISPEFGETFLTKLCTGVGLEDNSPINALRNKLLKATTDSRARLTQTEVIAYVIIAWKKFLVGEKAKNLRLPLEKVTLF